MQVLFHLLASLFTWIGSLHASSVLAIPLLGAISGYSALSDLDRARYNSKVRVLAQHLALHPQFFTQENIETRIKAAVFTVFDKISAAVADTLLTGTYDLTTPDPTTITESQVTVTAYERAKITCRAQGIATTGILDLADAQYQIVAINAAEGLDNAAAYAIYGSLAPTDALEGPLAWKQVLETMRDFENTPVPKFGDGLYGAVISPMTKFDLFGDPDVLKGFVPVSKYTNPQDVYNYEFGARFGCRFAVGGSAYHATVSNKRHDYPLFFGAGAFGQANGYDLEMVITNGLDALQRFTYVSWKAQRGYGVIVPTYARNYDCVPTA
jgi:hypothetical protein